jgi:hypothetical protein
MKFKKKIIIKTILLVLVLSLISTSSEHDTSQRGLVLTGVTGNVNDTTQRNVGENVGWVIHEYIHTNFHNTSPILTYRFHSNVTSAHKQLTIDGARLWTNVGFTVRETNPNSMGLIKSELLPVGGAAKITNRWVDVNDHLISWEVHVTTRSTSQQHLSPQSLSHEFGHAFGLVDLYDDRNKDKLMYHNSTYKTAFAPTTIDRNGASVITGQHTHNANTMWRFRSYDKRTRSTGHIRNIHRQACSGTSTSCGGFRGGTAGNNSQADCSYPSNGRDGPCTVCNTHRNGDVNRSGSVEINDALMIFQYIAGMRNFSPIEYYLADTDNDGKITTFDALEIQKYIAGMNTVIEKP